MTFIAPFPGGINTIIATFRDNDQDAVARTNYTFTGMSFGPAAATRYLIALANWSGSAAFQSINALLIAGNAATQIGSTVTSSDGRNSLAMFRLLVPTGTSGDVEMQLSGGSTFGTMVIYSLTGRATITPSITPSTASSPTATKTVPVGGAAIAGAITLSGSPGAANWTNLTEDCDNPVTSTRRRSTASRNTTPGLPSLAMTCSFGGGTSAGLFATFAP